jgi:hypothetical protein
MVWTLIVLVLHMPSVTATAPLAERVDDAAAARLGGDVLSERVLARTASQAGGLVGVITLLLIMASEHGNAFNAPS